MAALEKLAKDRLAEARAFKAIISPDMMEAYFFSAPQRTRRVTSTAAPPKTPPRDAADLQISIGIEESENFATTILNSFMPEGVKWASQRAMESIPEELRQEVERTSEEQTDKIFGMIWESNFYAEIGRALNPDLSVGTFGLIVKTEDTYGPVCCMAVPIRELELNVGPYGEINDRFVVRYTKYRFVRGLVDAEAKIPREIQEKIATKGNSNVAVTWGWWRDYEQEKTEGTEVWQYVEMIGETLVYEKTLKGAGCCPLVVATFNRHPEFPWGVGPLLKAAPELRVLDEMAAGEVDNVDLSLRPPMTYPEDSFVNIEANGVEPGAWYPIRPGTQDAVRKMYEPNRLDAVYFDQERRERRVRRLFYNDFPQQRGDTPPTATQWLDEMSMAQRKIGTPGLAFWEEGPGAIFARFRFIALERGVIEPINYPGNADRVLTMVPDNPTRRAQDQQEVMNAVRGLQMAAGFFPEEFKIIVDGDKTIRNIIQKLGGNRVVEYRAPGQIQGAVDMVSQLAGAGGNLELPTPGG